MEGVGSIFFSDTHVPTERSYSIYFVKIVRGQKELGKEQELKHFSFLLDTRKVFQLGSEEPSWDLEGRANRTVPELSSIKTVSYPTHSCSEQTGLVPSFPQSRQYHTQLIHVVSLRHDYLKDISLKQKV